MTVQCRYELSKEQSRRSYRVCPLCHRSAMAKGAAFCEGCLARAAAAPRPSPVPERVVIPPADHPRVRRSGYTARERAALRRVMANLGIDAP